VRTTTASSTRCDHSHIVIGVFVIMMLYTRTTALIRALTQQQADRLHSVFDGTAVVVPTHSLQLSDTRNADQCEHCKPACFTPAVIEQLCSEHEHVSSTT
jgi:hypothetical protein